MLSEDQIQTLAAAITAALPEGQVLHTMPVWPQVGSGDTGSKPLMARVIAESAKDVERFRQIMARGQAEYQREIGLVASISRIRNLHGPKQ